MSTIVIPTDASGAAIVIPTGGNPSSGISFIEADATWWTGSGTKEAGGSVVVNTAWAGSGNNFTTNVTVVTDDGFREGYSWRTPITPLLALLDTTEAKLLSGEDVLVAFIRAKIDPTDNVIGGLALTSGEAIASMDGGGGGYRGSTDGANLVTPCAFVAGSDFGSNGGATSTFGNSGFLVELPVVGLYALPTSIQTLDVEVDEERQFSRPTSVSTPFSPSPPVALHLTLFAGGNGSVTGGIDMDVWFAVRRSGITAAMPS